MSERTKYKYITSVVLYLRETWKNKVCALALIGLGVLSAVLTGDATGLVFILIFAIPLLLTMENWII
jgi:hypothetical protein